MQFDIYARLEPGDRRSYLAVPAGRAIPQEATNTDWQAHAQGLELDENAAWPEFGIDATARQLQEKGYAITSLKNLPDG